jgi:5'-nucleotidase/UDP-sugar diphosphatase
MKNILVTVSFLMISLSAVHAQKFTVLHTNDMHSRLQGFAPSKDYTPDVSGDDLTTGGFSRIAAYFNQVEKEIGTKPLILDGGDFLMGTLFQTLEPSEGFQLRLMKKMGYDVVAIGNHEFDLGVENLGKIVQSGKTKGDIPPLVLSNIQFNPSEVEDDLLKSLYEDNTVSKSHILNYNGLKIGFFGLMGLDAADVAPFVRPAAFTDRIIAAKETAAFLKESQKVDIVICLSHSGVSKDKKGNWIGEDVELAKEVSNIDLIISGHTHTHMFEPLVIDGTPIVQAGSEGRFVGRIDLEFRNGDLIVIDGKLEVIDDKITGDPAIQKEIDGYEEQIISSVFGNLGLSPGKAIVETGFDIRFNEQTNLETSNLGGMVADAIHWYVNQTKPNDITLAAAGLIRDEIISGSTGQQLANDLFRIVPLGSGVYDDSPGYSLAQVYLTGSEVKSVLEAMQLAPKMSSGNYPFWSGVKYKYNPRRILLDQVYEVSLGNDKDGYTPIDLSKNNKKLYSLTTNNYVLEFFGIISKATFGLLKVVPKDELGRPVEDLNSLLIDGYPLKPGLQEMKEWTGLIEYASSFPDLNGNGIPDVPDYYREAHLAGEKTPSLNPSKLWGNGNGIMAGVSIVGFSLLALTGLLILL